jgi:hypothetical protein
MIYSLAKNTSALLLPFHLFQEKPLLQSTTKAIRVPSDKEYKSHGLQAGKILMLENLSRFSSPNRVTNRSICLWNFLDLKAWMLEKQRQEHGGRSCTRAVFKSKCSKKSSVSHLLALILFQECDCRAANSRHPSTNDQSVSQLRDKKSAESLKGRVIVCLIFSLLSVMFSGYSACVCQEVGGEL